ncbi:MAG: hypothetical protein D5R99_01460 [Methanocalculus sp. MSAO_Arc1]|uniref:hypothetical protein n=1 Tax=Methanocalculus TaxID=71151 RepID=UPI000FF76474|nr:MULTISPECIES: hypothetical protein [unclassified Methanocalculus]MCP1662256.1 hypothetical protein [Methanocalculus sp. AMF5]RQD81710.1 MAG: hypothetical protein D5R99_01460 [Methanocalculus sp. MSAO_Arc1]
MTGEPIHRLQEANAGRAEALHALRHLPLKIRQGLTSGEYEIRRRSEGRFFEAIIYELLRSVAAAHGGIARLAAWGADAPPPSKTKQGIRYSRDGGIRICSAGALAAEIDLLFADTEGRIYFGEAATTHPPPALFRAEVERKRALIRELAGEQPVHFLYISPTQPPGGFAPLFTGGGSALVRPDLLCCIREIADVAGSPRRRRQLPHDRVVDGSVFFQSPAAGGGYIQRFFRK